MTRAILGTICYTVNEVGSNKGIEAADGLSIITTSSFSTAN